MARRCKNGWIASFCEYTAGIETPHRFRNWTAVSCIAGALARRVYVYTKGQTQWPNLFICFVADPGVGKGNAIKFMRPLAKECSGIYMAPSRIASKEALYMVFQKAGEAQTRLVGPEQNQQVKMEANVYAIVPEVSAFFKENDNQYFGDIADLFDNSPDLDYVAKVAESSAAEEPCLNLLIAGTPDAVRRVFSEVSLEQGLPSRILFIWGDPAPEVDRWTEPDNKHLSALRADLVHDLEQISMLRHHYIWTPEARKFVDDWKARGYEPKLTDARFQAYNKRRIDAHYTKLCMVMAADSGDEPLIKREHCFLAKELLLEAEECMPECFGGVVGNPFYSRLKTAARFVDACHRRDGKPVADSKVRAAMQKEVDIRNMRDFMENFRHSGFVTVMGGPESYTYIPNVITKGQWVKP